MSAREVGLTGEGAASPGGSVGVVTTRFFEFDRLALESGACLEPVRLAYETYGVLSAARDNAILCCHALSGDAHAAGFHEGSEVPGWWDDFIGPGKAFDTNRYFVICSNVLSGCRGSTGPSSVRSRSGAPYALEFPLVTIGDMVNAQRHLIDFLGIKRLLCVAGGSMGGMQALQWSVAYPERVQSVAAIATSSRHSPQQIAFNEVGRQAIMADPNWRRGRYYGDEPPRAGLAVARMLGHVTYLSEEALRQKFARRLQDKEEFDFHFDAEFQVESYLHHQGDKFVDRFDANSYLYITRALDYFDLAAGFDSLQAAFSKARARYLFVAFSSDWIYPPWQLREVTRAAKIAGRSATYFEVNTPYGHDAFLLESALLSRAVKQFLSSEEEKKSNTAPANS